MYTFEKNFFLTFILGGLLNNTGNVTGWKLLSGLWHNWHCFCFLLHKDKLRLSSALLPTFGNKRKRRSVTVRSQEFSRLIFLTARKKNFCAPFKKEGETKGVTGSNLPHLHQVLFRKSKWVNIQVGRREEEPLGKASFFASLSELYTMRTRIRLRAYRVRIRNIKRTAVAPPPPKKKEEEDSYS